MLGGWHPKALDVIARLGRQLTHNVTIEGGEVMCHLRQHLGFLLVQDNMAMMCSHMPTFAPLEVDGDADRDEPKGL